MLDTKLNTVYIDGKPKEAIFNVTFDMKGLVNDTETPSCVKHKNSVASVDKR